MIVSLRTFRALVASAALLWVGAVVYLWTLVVE